jgi:hypothetical protein
LDPRVLRARFKDDTRNNNNYSSQQQHRSNHAPRECLWFLLFFVFRNTHAHAYKRACVSRETR